MSSIYASVSLILFANKVIVLHSKVIACTYYMCFAKICKDRMKKMRNGKICTYLRKHVDNMYIQCYTHLTTMMINRYAPINRGNKKEA